MSLQARPQARENLSIVESTDAVSVQRIQGGVQGRSARIEDAGLIACTRRIL